MKYLLLVALSSLIISCADEGDCERNPGFNEKIQARDMSYESLRKNMTCYDEDGNPY